MQWKEINNTHIVPFNKRFQFCVVEGLVVRYYPKIKGTLCLPRLSLSPKVVIKQREQMLIRCSE